MSTLSQLTISKNGVPVASFWTNDLSSLPIEVNVPQFDNSGIKALAIVNWDKVDTSSPYVTINSDRINTKCSVFNIVTEEYNKWVGKKLLAIGDSITSANQWQPKVEELLNINITTHARGGIGIVDMVDGDGVLPALTSSDVAGKDCIILMGFYNDVEEITGTKTDMYPSDNTFCGRLNYAISRIYEELGNAGNTKCKIALVPFHKCGKNEWRNYNGYDSIYEEKNKAVKEVAAYNSLPLFNMYEELGINKYTWDDLETSSSPYNQNYIPSDGINDGTNKPFASLENAPDASQNINKYITIEGVSGCYKSNGSSWVADNTPCIWNSDQLHPNIRGYERIGEFLSGKLITI